MNYSEAWNKIVRRTEKIKSKNEEVVQYAWETHFEDMFGYNPEDIESQRPVQMGSTKRTDVVIKNNNNDLFVVEFKRHELSFNDKMQNQLFSYLDREKIDIGILVCDKLYIYDYDFTEKDKFIRLEIPLKPDHSDGVKFLELFSKANFNKQTIKDFIKEASERPPAPVENDAPSDDNTDNPQKLSKEQICNLCRKRNIYINTSNLTLAGRNGKNYPANVNYRLLSEDWWIALDDRDARKLHIFNVPAFSIKRAQVKQRDDKPKYFLFYIDGTSSSFLETKSNIEFEKWHKCTIIYTTPVPFSPDHAPT